MTSVGATLLAAKRSRRVPELFHDLAARAERSAASRPLVMVAFTLLYLIPTVQLARLKLFWDDEFYTLYLALTPDWKTLLQAMATGADQSPPSLFYLAHFILRIFGTGHVTLRLAAMIGFWVLCVCLYEIMRPLTSPAWAVVAMLFPLTTNFYYYATEARGYGPVLGFAALAMLSWLRATANYRRSIYVPLLAFSLAAAVGGHYYATLVAVCLGLGELVRTVSRRKIDWPICAALLFTGVPLLVFFQIIQKAKGYSSHFWAVPAWSDAISFYPTELGTGLIALLGALGLALGFGVYLGGREGLRGSQARAPLNAWQLTAIVSLSALPLLVMVLAKFVTHGFTDRYTISALVGVTILLCYFLFRAAPQPRAALVAALICVGVFGLKVLMFRAEFSDQRTALASDIRILSRTGDRAIAILGSTRFHRLSFYAPRQIATRLNYVADASSSLRYMGHDTVDRGLLSLNPWFPIKVLPEESFLEDNRDFLVYGNISSGSWITFDLPKWGKTTLVERDEKDLLFSGNDVQVSPSASVVAQERAAATRMLYWKTPQTGPALCTVYMGPAGCP